MVSSLKLRQDPKLRMGKPVGESEGKRLSVTDTQSAVDLA
jgi:hypothetical protein